MWLTDLDSFSEEKVERASEQKEKSKIKVTARSFAMASGCCTVELVGKIPQWWRGLGLSKGLVYTMLSASFRHACMCRKMDIRDRRLQCLRGL